MTPLSSAWHELALHWHAHVDLRDSCHDHHLLSLGYPLDALILTATGELYLYLDPLKPRECPYHRPERSERQESGDNHAP